MKWTILFVSLFMTVQVWACGGGDLTDAEIRNSSDLKSVMSSIEEKYDIPIYFQTLIRSGSGILNLQRKEVARAMCPANYINAYFSSEVEDELKCMITFTVDQRSGQMKDKNELVAVCSKNKNKPEKVEINFN